MMKGKGVWSKNSSKGQSGTETLLVGWREQARREEEGGGAARARGRRAYWSRKRWSAMTLIQAARR